MSLLGVTGLTVQSDHLGERSYKGFVGTCSGDCHQSQVKVVCQSSAGSLRRENLSLRFA